MLYVIFGASTFNKKQSSLILFGTFYRLRQISHAHYCTIANFAAGDIHQAVKVNITDSGE